MAIFSRRMGSVVSSVYSTVSTSQSNRAPLRCGGTGKRRKKRKKEKRLHELHDSFMPVRTKISEECFQNLAESMPQRIYAALKAKRGLKLKNNHVWYTGTHKSLSKRVKFIFIALFETRNGHKLLYRGNLIKSSPRQRQSGHTWMKKNNIVSVWTHEF